MLRRTALPPALILVLALGPALPGCGGTSDPAQLTREGYSQLNSGNASAAEASFAGALEHLQPGDPEFVRASLGLAQVTAADQPDRARDLFLELMRSHSLEIGDLRSVTGALVSARHFEQATALVEAGMQAFPESPRMAELRDYVGDAAQRIGAEVPAGLKGLGYVGSE